MKKRLLLIFLPLSRKLPKLRLIWFKNPLKNKAFTLWMTRLTQKSNHKMNKNSIKLNKIHHLITCWPPQPKRMKAKSYLLVSSSRDLYKLCLLKKYHKFNNLIWIRMMMEKQVFQRAIHPKKNKIRKKYLFPIKKLTSSTMFQLESQSLYLQKNKRSIM